MIKELKEGKESAFKLLVEQFQKKIYNTCLGLLQNNEDAEDATQEVFVIVYKSIHQFKGESKLSTWMYRIAVTKSLEHIRMKNRKKRFAFLQHLFTNDDGFIKNEPKHFYHPGVQLENKERATILFSAIDQLPENQKTAFILSKLEDLSYTEISEVMNLSVSSIESLLFRAKQNLQKLLENYYQKNEK
ncbi:MAG: RNA polymerase sigma factor [Bacteroidota bacterium]|nr:RNA polymerase sigma factor [Bacteroidota bacterium]